MNQVTKEEYEDRVNRGERYEVTVRNSITDVAETLRGYKWGDLFYHRCGDKYYRLYTGGHTIQL